MRTMNRLPECMVIVDPKKEKNAVKEARKLGVSSVALIDTDCDPDVVDLPIPGNDGQHAFDRFGRQYLGRCNHRGQSQGRGKATRKG